MDIVNGYPCFNCTDIENAKKNIDPAKAKQGVALQIAELEQTRDRFGPAVRLDGALAAAAARPGAPLDAVTSPSATGGPFDRPPRGTQLDVTA